jgi:hypothetical protein
MAKSMLINLAISVVSLLVVQVANGGSNYTVNDCKKIIQNNAEVSLPGVIYNVSSVVLVTGSKRMHRDIRNYGALKYPERTDFYENVHFAKTKEDGRDKLITNMAKYWGIADEKIPEGYWELVNYALASVSKYDGLSCGDLSQSERMDVIVLSMMALEVFPAKSEEIVFFAKDDENKFYYMVSKAESGAYSVELRININTDIFTVVASGESRDNLEAFVTDIVLLNTTDH